MLGRLKTVFLDVLKLNRSTDNRRILAEHQRGGVERERERDWREIYLTFEKINNLNLMFHMSSFSVCCSANILRLSSYFLKNPRGPASDSYSLLINMLCTAHKNINITLSK